MSTAEQQDATCHKHPKPSSVSNMLHKPKLAKIQHHRASTSKNMRLQPPPAKFAYTAAMQKKNLKMQKKTLETKLGLKLLFKKTADMRAFQELTNVRNATVITYTLQITPEFLILILYGCEVFPKGYNPERLPGNLPKLELP